MIVNPKFEKQLFKEPIIKSYKAPVTGLRKDQSYINYFLIVVI